MANPRTLESLVLALGAKDYVGRKAEGVAIPLRGDGVALMRRRQAAAKALGALKDVRAIKPLICALHDEPRVSARSVEALAQFDFEQVEQPINHALQHGNKYIQENVAKVLAMLRDSRAIELLIRLLEAEENTVRAAAAEALGNMADVRAVDPLIRALDNDDWRTREKVAEALGKLADKRAVDPLIRSLEDHRSTFGAGKAAEALGILGDERAVEPLIRSLDRGGFGVAKAVLALGQLADSRAVDPLVALARGGSKVAAEALRNFDFRDAGTPLVEALKHSDPQVRENAAKSLGILGNPQAVTPLIQALGDRLRQVREAAAHALGELGDASAIERLRDVATKDRSRAVKQAAKQALERFET